MANVANSELMGSKEELGERFGEKAKKMLDDASKSIRSQSEDAWEDVVAMVRKHPGKAIGIAVAAGLVFGSAISRGRRYTTSSHIKDLAGTGADAWSRVKTGLDEAVCNLRDAFEDAVEKFK